MIRFVFSVFALTAIVATAQPAFAGPLFVTVSDRAQIAATEQAALPTPPWSSSSGEGAPTSAGLGKDIVPIGFGWG